MEGYFRRLETENSIETRSWDQSRRSLTAHSRPGGEIEAEQGVTFDVMSFTLRDDEGEKLWVRQNTFRIDSSMSDLTYNALESGASRLRTAAPLRVAAPRPFESVEPPNAVCTCMSGNSILRSLQGRPPGPPRNRVARDMQGLNNLGGPYRARGRTEEAERLLRRHRPWVAPLGRSLTAPTRTPTTRPGRR